MVEIGGKMGLRPVFCRLALDKKPFLRYDNEQYGVA